VEARERVGYHLPPLRPRHHLQDAGAGQQAHEQARGVPAAPRFRSAQRHPRRADSACHCAADVAGGLLGEADEARRKQRGLFRETLAALRAAAPWSGVSIGGLCRRERVAARAQAGEHQRERMLLLRGVGASDQALEELHGHGQVRAAGGHAPAARPQLNSSA